MDGDEVTLTIPAEETTLETPPGENTIEVPPEVVAEVVATETAAEVAAVVAEEVAEETVEEDTDQWPALLATLQAQTMTLQTLLTTLAAMDLRLSNLENMHPNLQALIRGTATAEQLEAVRVQLTPQVSQETAAPQSVEEVDPVEAATPEAPVPEAAQGKAPRKLRRL